MDYVKLKAKLLEGHPVTGAFDAVAAVAAAQFNVVNRTRIRESMSGDEAFQQTDKVGFAGLTLCGIPKKGNFPKWLRALTNVR